MQELEALLHLITDAQRKKAQAEKAQRRAITVLEKILSLTHRDQPDFAPLLDCQAKARALREAIQLQKGSEAHSDVAALAQGRHPLAELLTLVEGAHDLDDDLWLLLKQANSEHFGKSLALSAARGKLTLSPTRLPVVCTADDRSRSETVSASDGVCASTDPVPAS